MKPLKTGYAYHGNRMINHVEEDLKDMAANNCNLVVHMLSHSDWNRHHNVMKKIVTLTEELGMEVWVDNWGIDGGGQDKSLFTAYHPDSRVIYSNGEMHPTKACYNSDEFRKFTKEWIDAVEYIGGKTIFWDEPSLDVKEVDSKKIYSCACERCRAIFKNKYGYDMPEENNADTEAFRIDTVVSYFRDVTAYSAEKGIKNSVCVMLGEQYGINLDSLGSICSISTVDNVGSDPYWGDVYDPYEFVYNGARRNLEVADKYHKDHNIWIQTFNNGFGKEESIITAADAAYDAGARTIIAWGYHGSISNDYASKNPLVVRAKTHEAFRRIWERERNRILAEGRARLGVNPQY